MENAALFPLISFSQTHFSIMSSMAYSSQQQQTAKWKIYFSIPFHIGKTAFVCLQKKHFIIK